MKMNWGKSIAAVYISFMIVTLGVVAFAFTQDVNLVTDDYYAQEIKYQDQIDRIQRTKDLPEQLSINLENEYIKLKFPAMFEPETIIGEIHIYRPSDSKVDIKIPVEVNSAGELYYPKQGIAAGLWKVKVNWGPAGNEYYNEQILMIN